MTTYYMDQCKRCHSAQQFLRPKTSHLLHVILSLITVGFWILVWILVAISHSSQAQCTRCGTSPSSGLRWVAVSILGIVVIGLAATAAHAEAAPEFTATQLHQVRLIRGLLQQGVFLTIDRPQTSDPRIIVARNLFRALPYELREESTRAVLAFFHGINPWIVSVHLVDEEKRPFGAITVGSGLSEWR